MERELEPGDRVEAGSLTGDPRGVAHVVGHARSLRRWWTPRAPAARREPRAPSSSRKPLPPPREVTAIPTVVAPSGMALACTPPRLDGQPARDRVVQPGATTARPGWDLEGVAFHEDIPGHHLQLSRIQVLEELPPAGCPGAAATKACWMRWRLADARRAAGCRHRALCAQVERAERPRLIRSASSAA